MKFADFSGLRGSLNGPAVKLDLSKEIQDSSNSRTAHRIEITLATNACVPSLLISRANLVALDNIE